GTATTRVSAGDLGLRYEGRTRPFYFDGVLTVEAKLFHLIRPDVAVYGERDLQREFLVRRMIRDLDFGIETALVPTVRAED
ncbi:pantoate--beta-alanine ligase, partial [Klebsiella pneumoniae]|uniref:pantoate--beta-alanine ligase n=2 Tax=Bacteria TaxID=2 RepID=UPI003012C27C